MLQRSRVVEGCKKVMKSMNCKQGKGLGKAGKLCGVCGDTIRQNEAESSEGDHL